jgi:DNA-binding XRE family transcriptional regulator
MNRRISAERIADIRQVLSETQTEFAERFSRSRFSIIRWERKGVKFHFKSESYNAWLDAEREARHIINTEGTSHEQKQNMRDLQTL